ncbi:MAG TPA: hypothetical protein D7H89_01560 [Candidatus Poseidoniales archaeon]|nr:MAG TPA: hypothetical protein D7H89_01560 [Candidatus Poseidoniales archaeon]
MPWEEIEEDNSGPDGVEFSWESIDADVPAKEFRHIDCQSCSQSLRVPTTYDGPISCPKCLVKFSPKDTDSTEKSGWRFFHFIFALTCIEGFGVLLLSLGFF